MTIGELVTKLQTFDQSLPVAVVYDDGACRNEEPIVQLDHDYDTLGETWLTIG